MRERDRVRDRDPEMSLTSPAESLQGKEASPYTTKGGDIREQEMLNRQISYCSNTVPVSCCLLRPLLRCLGAPLSRMGPFLFPDPPQG